MENKIKLDVIVYDKTKKKLKNLSKVSGLPISQIVEQAIVNFLGTKPKKAETKKSRMCLSVSESVVRRFRAILCTGSNRDLTQTLDKILNDFFTSKNKRLVDKNQANFIEFLERSGKE